MDGLEGIRAAAMDDFDHPHVAEVRRELVYEAGNWKHSLIIVTDLDLDPASPSHDGKTLNTIIQAVANHALAKGSGYHALVVRNP